MSGYAEEARPGLAGSLLRKPFDRAALSDAVDAVLRRA